ncbi:WbqC family protein [Aurantibacter crassamenti]|uniref:WbqC family protein n=1 Tax=Aurantibacter crassamenti TaxID=1837375 RepID=UPI00193A6DBD|nr:WbqC family protein [Aurantibacter crassamenti]MBM1106702.1 WbqC family protein [Aurantibacter crassamenti]
MKTLLHPTYFPNILSFATLIQNDVVWEVEDNFQKQTYRNRCEICNDQGHHLLSIPIKHVGGKQGRQKYKDVQIENSYEWQRQHWRTLQTAYRTSPYFEFYEDEIAPLYNNTFDLLLDYNIKTTTTILECLQLESSINMTTQYEKAPDGFLDARFLVNARKKREFSQRKYEQVFSDRNDFLENRSILDLLFNEGPNSVQYLKSQDLSFFDA